MVEMQLGSKPRRIRLSRARGWRLPSDAVSVAYPTKWQNPFRPTHRGPAEHAEAVAMYRRYLREYIALLDATRAELVGLDLACWCPTELDCHADVLLRVAAGEEP